MNTIRNLLAWLFAISSLLCLWHSVKFALRIINWHFTHLSFPGLLAVSIFPALAILYGIAWWTVWRKWRSGRFWGAVACLTYVVFPIWAVIKFRSLPLALLAMFVIGATALIIILWPTHEEPEPPSEDDLLSPD